MSLHSLRKRLEILEKLLSTAEITLFMADGSTRKITGKRLHGMMREVFGRGPMLPDTQLVADSVGDNNQGDRITELVRVMAAARKSVEEENRQPIQA
jgi:hypothetical protein